VLASLNDPQNAVMWSSLTAITTIVLVAITGIYAWLTHQLSKTAERQLAESTRPVVLISLETSQGGQLLEICLSNVGQSRAELVEARFDKLVYSLIRPDETMNSAGIFSKTIPFVPSGQKIRIALGNNLYVGENIDRTKHPLEFSVSVRYQSGNTRYEEIFNFDLEAQTRRALLDINYPDEFARKFPNIFEKRMTELNKEIVKLNTQIAALRNLNEN
jgi:hypothetical protein